MTSSSQRKPSVTSSWIAVLAQSSARALEIRSQLREGERPSIDDSQRVVVIDGAHAQLDHAMERELQESAPDENTLIAVWIDETVNAARRSEILAALRDGAIDDVIEGPVGALRWTTHCLRWEEALALRQVQSVSRELQNTLEDLGKDLQLVERLQRARAPKRFDQIAGFTIAQRYLAGARSGGDHFDLAQSKDNRSLSLILTDASSYGLSSAVLSALVRVSLALSREGTRSARETLSLLQGELLEAIGPKDSLSVIYGVLSRRDYSLRYVHQGTSQLYYSERSNGSSWRRLESQGDALRAGSSPEWREQCVMLAPGSRLVLLSDGFVEGVGGEKAVQDLLTRANASDGEALVTELVYQIKRQFKEADDLPPQDCTAAVLDLASHVLRQVP